MNTTGTFNRGQVTLLTLAHGTTDMYAGFLAPIIPALRESIGFSLAEGVFLVSLFALTASFSQLLFGILSDHWKSAKLVAIGVLVSTVAHSALGLAGSWLLLVTLVCICGLGVGAFHPSGAGLAGVHSGNRHAAGMGLFATGGAAGFALGAIIVTTLVSAWGLPAIALAAVFGVAVAIILYVKVRYDTPAPRPADAQSTPRRRIVLVIGVVAWMALIRAFVAIAFNAMLPTWLDQRGEALTFIGLVLGCFGFLGSLGTLIGGWLADRFGEKRILFSSFLLPVPFLAAFFQTDGWLSLVMIGIGGFLLMSSVSVVVIIAQRAFPQKIGTASSVVMGCSWGVGALLVVPAGNLADQIGLYPVLTGIVYAPLLAAAVTPLLIGRLPRITGIEMPPTRPDGS